MDAARYRCRMNVVESALERVSIRVYNHKMFRNRDGWNFLSGQKFRCVWSEKLENLLFQNVEFCFHETCLGLDLRRYACAMDMVDSAFERIDVGLFKPGIDYNVGGTFIALHQKLIWWNSSPLRRRSEKKKTLSSPSSTVPPCFWILVFLNLQPSGNTDTSYLKMFECLKYCYILPENGWMFGFARNIWMLKNCHLIDFHGPSR